MSLSPHRQSFRLTGWHVLAGLVAFFGVTAAVDGLMVADAYRTYPGEVSSNPYEDGLAWDTELDQQRAQRALGWRMTAGVTSDGRIELTAHDRDGAPVELPRIEARLERPATEQGRRQLRFVKAGPGVYDARGANPTGAWDLRLTAFDARGRRFDAERRLVWP
jgi:nitrogen fixation protein FixH